MRLAVKCCCCGLEQASFELPLRDEIVRNEPLWTRVPCPPCEVVLSREARERAYAEGGNDAVAGLVAFDEAGIRINAVYLPEDPPRS